MMAYSFNGANLNCLFTSSCPIQSHPLTMACWFSKSNTANPVLMAVANLTTGGRWTMLAGSGSNVNAAEVSSSGASTFQFTNATYPLNTWSHGAAVFLNSSSRTPYLNGVAGPTGTVNITPPPTNMETISLGARQSSTGPINAYSGLIAEAAVWNTALTNAEIASLAKGITPRLIRPQSLVYYAPLVRDAIDVRGGLAITNRNNGATVVSHPRIYA